MMEMEKYLEIIEEVIAKGKYKDTWESLQQYRVPDWYEDVKFGIFIHWGIFSVPAFANEWYSRNMYIQGSPEYEHHIKTYGPQKDFGYKDFIPMFKAENFHAEEWAALFKEAGAQYVMPVAEHHDGFQMYDSELSEFKISSAYCLNSLSYMFITKPFYNLQAFGNLRSFTSDVLHRHNAAIYQNFCL